MCYDSRKRGAPRVCSFSMRNGGNGKKCEKITAQYCISKTGWIYTEFAGLAALEGRTGTEVGVREKNGARVLTVPAKADGLPVYMISLDSDFDASVEEAVIPSGAGIIGPHAFWGWARLKRVRVPQSVKEVPEGAFFGTQIPEKRRKELYRRKPDPAEPGERPPAEPSGSVPSEPGDDIPF